MAYGIGDYTRGVAPSGDYPNGDIKNNPNGTLVDRTMMTDMVQFFQKLMADAGITPNGSDDNVSNGYQLMDALLEVTGGGAWADAGTPTITPFSGTITIGAGDVIYNRYSLSGKKITWQLQLRTVTIAGSPLAFYIDLPAALSGREFVNVGMRFAGLYDNNATFQSLNVTLSNNSGTGRLVVGVLGGAALTNGTDNQSFDIHITAELT